MKIRKGWKNVCAVFVFSTFAATASPAQTYDVVADLNGTDGSTPDSNLVQGFNGNFYGTTQFGATAHDDGTIFEVTAADGTISTGYTFYCSKTICSHGGFPQSIVQGADGNFYGSTAVRSGTSFGTVFKITPGGTLTTLHSFSRTDGSEPIGALVQGRDGNFYGTTLEGGASNLGTFFKISSGGTFTSLFSFCSPTCADGGRPIGGLVQAPNGNFYGITESYGVNGLGTVFQITPGGTLTTLHSFANSDGAGPNSGLVLAADGNLYGTMKYGGTSTNCFSGCGTIFKITQQGELTTLYTFCSETSCLEGYGPLGGLVQATDGNFYGTTAYGTSSAGTIFRITPAGVLTPLHGFCLQDMCTDGSSSTAALMQATDGKLYGTGGMGEYADGTVFSMNVGLAPFVKTNPTVGKVGWKITVLGNDLTGATGVSFNGTAASFTVGSGTKITATVPTGATSGTVTVTTPSGTLNSNAAFQVLP